MTKPMKPSEVHLYKKDMFPPFVFEAFNQCIAAGFCNGSATVKQDAVIDKIVELAPEGFYESGAEFPIQATRRKIFDAGWLNIEDVYRAEGWKVEYDKPGYNESYGAYFKFKVK